MTTNDSQDVPEPLRSMVEREPLAMLDDEPEGYPLEACRGIGVMLLFTALLALIGACVWMIVKVVR